MNFKIEDLGEFLKLKRNEKKLTVRCVACSTNLSPGYISRLENNSSVPSFETLAKLSKILNFDLNDVVDMSINIENTFDILDIFSNFDLKFNDRKLSKVEKEGILDMIKAVYELTWSNDVEKLYGITKIFEIIKTIKEEQGGQNNE